jgi:hypothetical protein
LVCPKFALYVPYFCGKLVKMTNQITIAECLRRLEAGEMAKLEVYSFDKERKKGGELLAFECVLETGTSQKSEVTSPKSELALPKSTSPNHSFHYTRNVRICVEGVPSSVTKKIHIPLIKSFNNIPTVP